MLSRIAIHSEKLRLEKKRAERILALPPMSQASRLELNRAIVENDPAAYLRVMNAWMLPIEAHETEED